MDYSKKVVSGTFMAMLPVLLVALVIFALMLVPFLFIWSVNLLFGVEIAFNFWNSVAIYVLLFLLSGGKTVEYSSRK